jgi:hypothetical protein
MRALWRRRLEHSAGEHVGSFAPQWDGLGKVGAFAGGAL